MWIFPLKQQHVRRQETSQRDFRKSYGEADHGKTFQEFLPGNGFNHKCNWWINIVTWRGMVKWNAQIICRFFFFSFSCPDIASRRNRTRLAKIPQFMHKYFSWRFFLSLFNQWREMIFIFYGKRNLWIFFNSKHSTWVFAGSNIWLRLLCVAYVID